MMKKDCEIVTQISPKTILRQESSKIISFKFFGSKLLLPIIANRCLYMCIPISCTWSTKQYPAAQGFHRSRKIKKNYSGHTPRQVPGCINNLPYFQKPLILLDSFLPKNLQYRIARVSAAGYVMCMYVNLICLSTNILAQKKKYSL